MPRRLDTRRRLSIAAGSVVIAVAVLAGCAALPSPAPTAPSIAASPSQSPTRDAPTLLLPGGTAEENLPYFAAVVERTAASGAGAAGRSYIDALVAAGFDRARMQVTPDDTTIGNPAESVEFSVRWGGECLVGQVGPAIGEPVATVLPGLAGDRCLIGTTRVIDW